MHQGKCDTCKIVWVWNLNIRLRDQVCAQCGRGLIRATKVPVGYGFFAWEGYYFPLVPNSTSREAAAA